MKTGLFKVFKATKPIQFTFKPRYWDPEKEKKEEARRLRELAASGSTEGMKSRIAMTYGRGSSWIKIESMRKMRRRQANKSSMRVLYIIILLCFMLYLFLQTDIALVYLKQIN